jgi:hypothetical protein
MKRHGSYTLQRSNDTLLVQCLGSWNLETARFYSLEYKAVVAPIIHQDWAMVCDLRQWELATPECMPIFHSLTRWCFDKGMKSCIYIYEQSFVMQLHLKEVTPKSGEYPRGYNFQKVDSLESVYDWLKSHGHDVEMRALLMMDKPLNGSVQAAATIPHR